MNTNKCPVCGKKLVGLAGVEISRTYAVDAAGNFTKCIASDKPRDGYMIHWLYKCEACGWQSDTYTE